MLGLGNSLVNSSGSIFVPYFSYQSDFTSDDNGSEPILVWHEDDETWVELQEIIDELNLSINDYEIIEELISSNLIQQYENDDVIDVKSELGIE